MMVTFVVMVIVVVVLIWLYRSYTNLTFTEIFLDSNFPPFPPINVAIDNTSAKAGLPFCDANYY